jgi:hypothetical protein
VRVTIQNSCEMLCPSLPVMSLMENAGGKLILSSPFFGSA